MPLSVRRWRLAERMMVSLVERPEEVGYPPRWRTLWAISSRSSRLVIVSSMLTVSPIGMKGALTIGAAVSLHHHQPESRT